MISIYELLFAFPAPIILALLLNEIRLVIFKRVVQTISYLPHFISIVVVAGMLVDFAARDGLVNNMLGFLDTSPSHSCRSRDGFARSMYPPGSGKESAGVPLSISPPCPPLILRCTMRLVLMVQDVGSKPCISRFQALCLP